MDRPVEPEREMMSPASTVCPTWASSCESVVTSEFGYRSDPFTGETRGHTGMDLAVPTGTPIRAALPGTITVSQYSSSYGYYVMIDHGNGLSTLYGHRLPASSDRRTEPVHPNKRHVRSGKPAAAGSAGGAVDD